MGYQRLAYDDADPTSAMWADCDRATLRLPVGPIRPTHPLTSWDEVERGITVDDAAVRLAAALDLG